MVNEILYEEYLDQLLTHNQGEDTLVARMELPSDKEIIFLSDIHIEGGIDTRKFLESLFLIAENYSDATFVINGDLFNGIRDIENVIGNLPAKLIELLAGINIIYVSGDHDGTTAFSEHHENANSRYFTEAHAKKLFPKLLCFTDVLILDVRKQDGSVSTFYVEHNSKLGSRQKEIENIAAHKLIMQLDKNIMRFGPIKHARILNEMPWIKHGHNQSRKFAERYLKAGIYLVNSHLHSLLLNGVANTGELSVHGAGFFTVFDPDSGRLIQYPVAREIRLNLSNRAGYHQKSEILGVYDQIPHPNYVGGKM